MVSNLYSSPECLADIKELFWKQLNGGRQYIWCPKGKKEILQTSK